MVFLAAVRDAANSSIGLVCDLDKVESTDSSCMCTLLRIRPLTRPNSVI